MKEQLGSYEKENYLGLTTLQCVKRVLFNLPEIELIQFSGYKDNPGQINGNRVFFHLKREELLAGNGKLGTFLHTHDREFNTAFDSLVKLRNGETGFIPLMDLAIEKEKEDGLKRTEERFKELIVPDFGGGYFLETNKSYHFIGEKVLSRNEWLKFLGSALLCSIVTVTPPDQHNIHEMICDYRYIGHALRRGTIGLRITTRDTKSFMPHVVAKI